MSAAVYYWTSLDKLLETTGNNYPVFIELLHQYLQSAPAMLDELEKATLLGDQASILHHAHSLKSCLALIGSRQTQQRMAAIEKQAAALIVSQDIDFAVIRSELKQIEYEIKLYLSKAENRL